MERERERERERVCVCVSSAQSVRLNDDKLFVVSRIPFTPSRVTKSTPSCIIKKIPHVLWCEKIISSQLSSHYNGFLK